MLRTVMAIVAAGAIVAGCSDAFAWGGGRGHGDGGGGGGGGSTQSVSSSASYEYSSQSHNVPEPGTIVLLVSGAAGAAWWVRRRK